MGRGIREEGERRESKWNPSHLCSRRYFIQYLFQLLETVLSEHISPSLLYSSSSCTDVIAFWIRLLLSPFFRTHFRSLLLEELRQLNCPSLVKRSSRSSFSSFSYIHIYVCVCVCVYQKQHHLFHPFFPPLFDLLSPLPLTRWERVRQSHPFFGRTSSFPSFAFQQLSNDSRFRSFQHHLSCLSLVLSRSSFDFIRTRQLELLSPPTTLRSLPSVIHSLLFSICFPFSPHFRQ